MLEPAAASEAVLPQVSAGHEARLLSAVCSVIENVEGDKTFHLTETCHPVKPYLIGVFFFGLLLHFEYNIIYQALNFVRIY